jgi:hypothetical protein
MNAAMIGPQVELLVEQHQSFHQPLGLCGVMDNSALNPH